MSSLIDIHCPLCGFDGPMLDATHPYSDDHIHKYGELYDGVTKSSWKICGRCAFVHQNPRPSVEALNAFYARGGYHGSEAEDPLAYDDPYRIHADWYYGERVDYAVKSQCLEPGRAFDIGFGRGEALWALAQRGWQAAGMEPDPRLARFVRDEVGLEDAECGVFSRAAEPSQKVDLIFSNHTLEHVADLDSCMEGIVNILSPGGYVVTIIPTYYKNSTANALKAMNSAHYSLFTHKSLNVLFTKYGLECVSFGYSAGTFEKDELWHLARFTGKSIDPTEFYDDPLVVERYIAKVCPLRAKLLGGFFDTHKKKKRAQRLHTVLTRLSGDFPGVMKRQLLKLSRSKHDGA